MKSSDIDQELFTESYCKVCSAQLISESQRVAHYESRKHASKVRLYYMLHPVDGGCPAKKLRSENGSDGDSVDKNKCCTLCNMSFTSAVVAESHYQGKIHAKRLKLLLGEQPALKATVTIQMEHRCPVLCWCFQEKKWPNSWVSHKHHVSS
uniref:Zinc finger matrin-type 4 n=1 Tax=Junco hyemalis TaxID=40217 RepID=A0A8C5NJG6_JUNHY